MRSITTGRGTSGRNNADDGGAQGLGVLFRTPTLGIFAGCALLFHFANAPLLPLVGQKLALAISEGGDGDAVVLHGRGPGRDAAIALVVGWNADQWGRRPIFLIAFAALPIRAALYTVSDNAFWLLGVQLLDGVGAGIYQALTPLF